MIDSNVLMSHRAFPSRAVRHLIAVIILSLGCGSQEASRGQSPVNDDDRDSLSIMVSRLRKEKELVGLAAMVMVDGKVTASAVDGERRTGSNVPLETGDRWHLGSITKSVTATMIARLVESGKVNWSDTVGDCFPDEAIHKDWKSVTLSQLLTHTAGAPPNFPLFVMMKRPSPGSESTQARRRAVLDVVAKKPEYRPGTKHVYSNVGYSIAGAMVEHMTDRSWSDLVRGEVFEPLKLSHAGFGPPRSPDSQLNEPRGHVTRLGFKIAMDDQSDNTAIIGPAGLAHMTLQDLCTYATEHMRGHQGRSRYLSSETWQTLHAPKLNGYGCGWITHLKGPGVPYTHFWHNGSNTMWYALVVFAPEKNTVVAVTSNDGDVPGAEAAAWEIVNAYFPSGVYPKKSPFGAIRWKKSMPEVRLGSDWYRLVSLDGIPTEKMLAFGQETYGNRWKKRFEEDLVELLTIMGHPPQDSVTLVVESVDSGEQSIRKNVRMTEANRKAIRAASRRR